MIIIGEKAKEFVSEYVKINPAGIDIKPKKIFRIPFNKIDEIFLRGKERGYIINGKFVKLTDVLEEIKPKDEFWELEEGYYYVVFPRVTIPPDVMALAFPRSTLNRLGIQKFETAVFDPGYSGEFNQTFYFPKKAKIHINEAWIQLVFFKLEETPKELYNGYWQNEKY